MKKKKAIKTIDQKEAIVSEYLTGKLSYRQLGAIYGVDFRRVHSWVMEYQGTNQKAKRASLKKTAVETLTTEEVNELQKEVRRLQLYNKLLNTIIDVAEDQLKIDIRKKSGTKQ